MIHHYLELVKNGRDTGISTYKHKKSQRSLPVILNINVIPVSDYPCNNEQISKQIGQKDDSSNYCYVVCDLIFFVCFFAQCLCPQSPHRSPPICILMISVCYVQCICLHGLLIETSKFWCSCLPCAPICMGMLHKETLVYQWSFNSSIISSKLSYGINFSLPDITSSHN